MIFLHPYFDYDLVHMLRTARSRNVLDHGSSPDPPFIAGTLNALGRVATDVLQKARDRALADAPLFHALSFFESNEVIATKILSYLINPYANHGQSSWFLTCLLRTLGVIGVDEFPSRVLVSPGACCFTSADRGFMDILIEFTTAEDFVVVLESKSHDAADQPNQLTKYLQHIHEAYPHRKKRLIYLGDGADPDEKSIPRAEWKRAVKSGVCSSRNYHDEIHSWIAMCGREHRLPQKLTDFLESFQTFVGIIGASMENHTYPLDAEVSRVINENAFATESASSELEAVIQLSVMGERVWEIVLRLSMERVMKELQKRLPGWFVAPLDIYLDDDLSHRPWQVIIKLWKPLWEEKGDPKMWVYLGTECSKGPTHLDLAVQKAERIKLPTGFKFAGESMKLGLEKTPSPLYVNGIEDLRSADGIRYLLTSQAVNEIVEALIGFISKHEDRINLLFDSISSPGLSRRSPRNKPQNHEA